MIKIIFGVYYIELLNLAEEQFNSTIKPYQG